MRRLRAVFLFLVLLALCACGQAAPEPDSEFTIAHTIEDATTYYNFTVVATRSRPAVHTEAETTESEPTTYVTIKTSKNDPYSYVVNAYYAIAQNRSLLYDEESPPENLAQGFQLLPSTEYSNGFFALEYMIFINQSNLFYALYDINGDGTKELLLGAGGDYFTNLFDIYTIRNGVAEQQLTHPGSTSSMSIFKNGTVKTSYGRQGSYGDSYYRFKGGQLLYCLSLLSQERWISDDEWTVDYFKSDTTNFHSKVQISQEEYDRLRREYESNGREVEISWRPVAEYGK